MSIFIMSTLYTRCYIKFGIESQMNETKLHEIPTCTKQQQSQRVRGCVKDEWNGERIEKRANARD